MKQHRIETKSYRFDCMEWEADGPCVLLLHGFPETPHIFEEVGKQLSEQGYRAVAPYLPGYGTSPKLNKETSVVHLTELANVLGELAATLKEMYGPIILVGHDWGAVCSYVTAAQHPELFERMLTIAVPPLPVFLKKTATTPAQWLRSSYIALFQLRFDIPERLMSARQNHLLSKLCKNWSGKVPTSTIYFDKTTKPFKHMGKLKNALGYYRGLVPISSGSIQKWRASLRLAFEPIQIPSKILVGENDGCIPAPMYEGYEDCFTHRSELVEIKRAGHFVPLDQPEEVVAHITN